MKINKVSPRDNEFLKILDNIAIPPKILYSIGNLPKKRLTPVVAIVGSRRPTSYGREITYKLSYDLASQGVIIISGLALGVDAIAHSAALDAKGTTLAIIGSGLGKIYPRSNQALADRILQNDGVIISEYRPDEEAHGFQFLQRNRLVSGLSDGVLVTEATVRSGTVSTVTHALEQGKEVFAVPGSITSPLSAGCNGFIKQGASLVSESNDILEVIAPNKLRKQKILPLGNNEFESKIIDLIQAGIRDGDELQIKSGIEISEFLTAMTTLELNGVIRPLGGNVWTLK